jgi:hypothetical protein
MRIVEFVTDDEDIQRILASRPRGPPSRAATLIGSPQLRLPLFL